MDVDSESRQGVLTAAKAKLVALRNLRIKGQAEQPEPTRFSEKSIFTVAKLRDPDPLECETIRYKRRSSNHFRGGGGERRPLEPIFRERNT